MEYLFISFAQVDRDIVEQLVGRLESAGYKTWLADEGDRPGEQLSRQTVFAIERSDAFLLALSPKSIDSDSLHEQLRIAESAEKPILSMIVNPVSLPPDLRQVLDSRPVIDISHDLDDGCEMLVKWLEDGDTTKVGETLPAEWIGGEYIGEIQRLPEENDIWIEDGYYWYKNWKSLTSIKAHLTNKRLIFFWDSRDAWKWNKNEWDELGEAFPISLHLIDIGGVGQIQKPKSILIFATSKPFVEIEMLGGDKHKITLLGNFEERLNHLRQVVGETLTRD